MPLKAGTMTTGTEADFADSMAAAIESAFHKEWTAVYPQDLEDVPERLHEFWRAWFAAIAQGVVRYLADHADAFDVHSVAAHQDGGVIASEGLIQAQEVRDAIGYYGGGTGGPIAVAVAQIRSSDDPSHNRVETEEGKGRIEIQTTGVLHP